MRMGVKVNAFDRNHWTLLHHAAATNQEEALVKLVELGADLHASDTNGNTPLHLASVRRYVGVSRRLIILGADVEACNHKGQTPIARQPFFLQSIINEIMSLVSKSTPQLLRATRRTRSADTHATTRTPQPSLNVKAGTAASQIHAGRKGRQLSAHSSVGLLPSDNIVQTLSRKTAATSRDGKIPGSCSRAASTHSFVGKAIPTRAPQTARDAQTVTLTHTPRRAATTAREMGGGSSFGRTDSTQLPAVSSNASSSLQNAPYRKRPFTVGLVDGAAGASVEAIRSGGGLASTAGSIGNMFERLQCGIGTGNDVLESIYGLASAGRCLSTSGSGSYSRQSHAWHPIGASTNECTRRLQSQLSPVRSPHLLYMLIMQHMSKQTQDPSPIIRI